MWMTRLYFVGVPGTVVVWYRGAGTGRLLVVGWCWCWVLVLEVGMFVLLAKTKTSLTSYGWE